MARSLQKNREIVFQLLYSRDFEKNGNELALVMRTNAIPKKAANEANEKVETIWQFVPELDSQIQSISTEYAIERISQIERAILRLGLYEILHTDVPPLVAITEAVRLAKKYATAEAASFVNAILDGIYKGLDHATLPKEQTLT